MADTIPVERLTKWQREMHDLIVAAVPASKVLGRGRRAGWSVLLAAVEETLKWRGGPSILWDGQVVPPTTLECDLE